MRLYGTAAVPRVDIGTFALVPPAMMAQWRQMRFDHGMLVDPSGTRREGMRVAKGSHPLAGTCYFVVTARTKSAAASEDGDVSETTWETSSFELLDTSPDSLHVRGQDLTNNLTGELECRYPRPSAGPDEPIVFEAKVGGKMDGPWLIRGPLHGRATVSITNAGPGGAPSVHVVAKGRHRHAAGRAEVTIEPADPDSFDVTVDVRFHGRGVVRPLMAIGFGVGGRWVRRGFADGMAKLPRSIDEFLEEFDETIGSSPTPEEIAKRMIADALTDVAETLPET